MPPSSRALVFVGLLTACGGGKSSDDTGAATDGAGSGSDGSVLDRDMDGYDSDVDCDDTNAARNPGVAEVCNGVDDDCDGEVDEGIDDMPQWYADLDGDGRGDPTTATGACSQPYGMVEDGSDCDDASSISYPGATELCDGRDNDCDDEVDEGRPPNAPDWYEDLDGDGYGGGTAVATECEAPSEGLTTRRGDCDDTDAAVHPSAPEDTTDGIDNNCDGLLDLVGIYTGRLTVLMAQDAPEPGVYECEAPYDARGVLTLDPDELCAGCDFGFAMTYTPDRSGWTEGCGDGGGTFFADLSVGETGDGSVLYYQFSYSYYGYSYSYWTPWAYAETDGYDMSYHQGYRDRLSGGSYDTDYFYGAGTVY